MFAHIELELHDENENPMIPTVHGRRERPGHSKGTLYCCRESSYSTPETRKAPRSPAAQAGGAGRCDAMMQAIPASCVGL